MDQDRNRDRPMKPNFRRALRNELGLVACAAVWALGLFALPGLRAAAQGYPGVPVRVYTGQPNGQSVDAQQASADGQALATEQRLRALNAERQKALVSDTGKLLKLAQELNAELAAGNADQLTAAQLRTMAEIEKLAHSVKAKMSTSVRGLEPNLMPLTPIR